jgi:hypothetical protein
VLPNATSVRVGREKIEGYLLSPTHPVGRLKARFFESLGFTLGEPEQLVSALKEHAVGGVVVDRITTRFGTKFVVEGSIEGPAGEARLCSVWMASSAQDIPRLITAYPAQGRGGD